MLQSSKQIRPISITVLCWILIVLSCWVLFSLIKGNISLSKPFQYLPKLVGPIILLVCSIAMLKGLNWARYLLVMYLICLPILILIFGADKSELSIKRVLIAMLPLLIIVSAVGFILFRREANEYFIGKS